jgi:hypothetical protein
VDDLGILEEMPLRVLELNYASATDLTPLAGLPLENLNLHSPAVDIRALSRLPLSRLILCAPNVRDLSPLRGRPLAILDLRACRAGLDVSPLAECRQLEQLVLPPQPVRVDALRGLPNQQMINSLPWREFWRRYDETHPSE